MSLFVDAIYRSQRQGTVPIIAEIKLFSPAEGDLIGKRDPVDIARHYVAGGACCLSVVSGKWFKGSPELVRLIAHNVPEIPILRKDFIVTASHIQQSLDLGASAVLLTYKLMPRNRLITLLEYCLQKNIVPFIEIDSREHCLEIQKLPLSPESSAKVIVAIHNKNIEDQETSPANFENSLACIAYKKNKMLFVSASGIDSVPRMNQLKQAGFDAFLIGSHFMKAADIVGTVARFVQNIQDVENIQGKNSRLLP